jgi:MATE family, multidrug efflux pump
VGLRFVLVFQTALWPLIAAGSFWLAHIFSDDPAVIRITRIYLWIMPLGIGLFGALIVINTGFNSAHQSYKTLLCNLMRLFVFYTPCAWAGERLFGIPGLFAGSVIGNGLAALFAWRLFNLTYDALEQGTAATAGAREPELPPDVSAEFSTAPVD